MRILLIKNWVKLQKYLHLKIRINSLFYYQGQKELKWNYLNNLMVDLF
jgi:hypothetical protein